MTLYTVNSVNSQTTGDIAIIGFNVETTVGDKDFSILALADISANSTIYITDNEPNGAGGFTSGEGALSWFTGNSIIKQGTVVVFSNVVDDTSRSVSIGSVSEPDAGFNPTEKDGLFIYTGTDENTVTNFIYGLRIGNDATQSGDLTGTSLITGTTHAIIDNTASPDGGYYNGSKSSESIYSNYLTLISDKSNWSTTNGNGEDHTIPFSKESFTILTTNWLGAISSSWNEPLNWDNGVPNSSSLVSIPDLMPNAPEISTTTNAEVGNISISEADGLSVLSGSLTVHGNITVDAGSSLYLESKITASKTLDAATLILNGNYTSVDDNSFFYFTETFIDDTSGWSLISSPTVGELIDGNTGDGNFAVFNALQQSATNYGIAFYDNSQSDANLRWDYYSKAEVDVANTSAVLTMEQGKGYSILPNSALNSDTAKGNLGFKGDAPASDISIAITDKTTSSGNAFNLVGNPYPAYLPFNTTANSNNLLSENSGVLDEETLWIWDKTSNEYITVNQTTTIGTGTNQRPSLYIAPAQSFFVKSNSTGGDFKFKQADQNHQTTGTFNKVENLRPEINLNITTEGKTSNTSIYYYSEKTTGFDNGYDSSIFTGAGDSFIVYTKLVSAETNKKLAIQTLPKTNFDSMIIPVGVNAPTDSEITFSANSINLPKEHNVYLEDRLTGTFTLLDTSSTYVATVKTNNTEDRFFIHTKTNEALNVENLLVSNISIFQTSNKNLKLTGFNNEKVNISIFNILGKNVLKKELNIIDTKNITLPNLTPGVYIVKLETLSNSINKKIILK
ncbi:T9SS type A sorting domain-containing protein [uncultured Polaribacter sp.]|uniref:T9SS type A sorting domain-containing protein n=1 Tax=uncultured Polaribacter sp. TaxID=174711 RepID=UPI00260FDC53|nr:T9SS type A sorting domain-containing protein [uncultured Polaribacter sp.]